MLSMCTLQRPKKYKQNRGTRDTVHAQSTAVQKVSTNENISF